MSYESAGQADAKDPAKFTIGYELDGTRGTIDGVLTADDHVRLTPDRWLADREAKADPAEGAPSSDVRKAVGKVR